MNRCKSIDELQMKCYNSEYEFHFCFDEKTWRLLTCILLMPREY